MSSGAQDPVGENIGIDRDDIQEGRLKGMRILLMVAGWTALKNLCTQKRASILYKIYSLTEHSVCTYTHGLPKRKKVLDSWASQSTMSTLPTCSIRFWRIFRRNGHMMCIARRLPR